MFTGLIRDLGAVVQAQPEERGGLKLTLESGFTDLELGESVATNGVCLTAMNISGGRFEVQAGPETLARTTVGALRAGARVNLERSLTLRDRLGGHMVHGHVDEVGTVRSVEPRENAWDIWISATPATLAMIIPRGSVAVDGVSLTVVDRDEEGFMTSIIPHTWTHTNLHGWGVGTTVNLEVDMLARYVRDLVERIALPAPRQAD